MNEEYLKIVSHYEDCFKAHGDSHLGVDWPRLDDAEKRYQVMTEISKMIDPGAGKFSLLDFGCGLGHLLEFLNKRSNLQFDYSGLDISTHFVEACKKKFPKNTFYQLDILKGNTAALPQFDFVVMNGVFTEKRELSYEEMEQYFFEMLKAIWPTCKIGLAFNVMSKNVDWERDDLFHVSADKVGSFLSKNISRKFVLRHDYGLYEYTTYVYR